MLFQITLYCIILTFIICADSYQPGLIQCGNFSCIENQGYCFSDVGSTNSTCVCEENYATYPQNETLMCNYEKKSHVKALILELFIPYGAGHFYTKNYQFAVPKMFFFIVGYCLFIVLRTIYKSAEDNNTTGLVISLIAMVFCTGMVSWQLADLVMYGLSFYKDGNGIELTK
jgi:hypothetical protein